MMDGYIVIIDGEKTVLFYLFQLVLMLVILGRCEVAKLIKTQLENIGMVVTIKEISDSKYNAYLTNKNYQILLTGVYNSYSPDITYFYGENNIANYSFYR